MKYLFSFFQIDQLYWYDLRIQFYIVHKCVGLVHNRKYVP